MAAPRLTQSMTGFARADGAGFGLRWTWELRSVNGKGLDIRFRGPPGSDHLEPVLREKAAARMTRGSVQANLTQQKDAASSSLRINRAALAELSAALHEVRGTADPRPLILEQLLLVRGVVDLVEDESQPAAEATAAIVDELDRALDALVRARTVEGAAVAAILGTRLDRIAELTAAAENNPARQPAAIKARLAEQIATLLDASSTFDPDRLHQEALLIAAKADIREELDRLVAHVDAGRRLFAEGGAIGRRLDFLAQELNRETNTLCAKANDISLTQIGLELKLAVDQFREQVQNLE